MASETGIFTQDEANTGHLFSYRLAQYIANFLTGKTSIIDLGCGPGTYCRYFKDRGFLNVVGVEGLQLENFEYDKIQIFDLSKPFQLEWHPGHELKTHVVCIEVGEHIPREFEKIFIENIKKHVEKNHYLFISWAHEGQQGYGHVNCRPDWYIKQEFEAAGFRFEKTITEEIRRVPEGHVAYLKENLFVFRKR